MSNVCLAVGYGEDGLLHAVMRRLRLAGSTVIEVATHELNDLPVTLRDGHFTSGQHRVTQLVWRCPPDGWFSSSFVVADQNFADVEARAVWLAALNLPTVRVLNRYDAIRWFENSGWSTFRRLLIKQGIPVSTVRFGNQGGIDTLRWLPFHAYTLHSQPHPALQRLMGAALTPLATTRSYLLVCGELFGEVEAAPPAPIVQTQRLLAAMGIQLAEIVAGEDDAILAINTTPSIAPAFQDEAVARIVDFFAVGEGDGRAVATPPMLHRA